MGIGICFACSRLVFAVFYFALKEVPGAISFLASFWVFPIAIVILVKQNMFMLSARICSVVLIANGALASFLGASANGPLASGALFLIYDVFCAVRYRLAISRGFASMAPYRDKYDAVWKKIQSSEEADLRVLEDLVSQQLSSKKLQPYKDLLLLLAHAQAINNWYQGVVSGWALHCSAEHNEAPLKKTTRALEKIARSYGGESGALTDMVRSSIVCFSISHVIDVFSVVAENSTIHVIKNRFSLQYDGLSTHGYRDVNLQLSFPETEGTAFDGFVFELQLHLKDILALKDDNGHKLYIALRNLIGD